MRDSARKLLTLAAAGLPLLLTACDLRPGGPPEDDLLWHVPADSAYVLHNRRPLPAGFQEKWLAMTSDLVGWYRQLLAREMTEARGAEHERFLALADALLAELEGNMSPEGLARLGLRSDGRAVVFADGLLPAGRHEIADAARLWAYIGRVESRLGLRAERGRFGEVEYLRLPIDGLVFLLGTTDRELVWALVRRVDEAERLPRLFGDERPAATLAESGEFDTLLDSEALPGYGDGYIDLARLFEAARAAGVSAAGTDLAHPACAALGERFLAAVPRVVLGTTEVSADGFASRMRVETDAVVGEHLAGLAYPVPGMGETDDALFAFGMGIDVPRLRAGLRTLMRYLADAGRGCPAVNGPAIERAVPQMELALGPMTAMFKGLYLELLELEPGAAGEAPGAVRARAVAAVDDPRGVFAMAGMLSPELARLEVPGDGTPTAIPAHLLPPEAPELTVAIRERALVLAAGADGARLAAELVSAPPAKPAPLLVARYDVARLSALMGNLGEAYLAALAEQGGEDPAELLRELEASRRMYEAYERASVTVTAGPRGLQVDQSVVLK